MIELMAARQVEDGNGSNNSVMEEDASEGVLIYCCTCIGAFFKMLLIQLQRS